MSTHCGIAIKTDKGYETIYCHHDGMTSRMLPKLQNYYNSETLANLLISGGDASSIGSKFESTNENHSFDNPEKDVCVFYHRDRGEDWTATRPTVYDKNRAFDTYYYLYIWENGCWTAYADGKKVNI